MRVPYGSVLLAALLLPAGAGRPVVAAPESGSPEARHVVVRRVPNLAAAIVAAFGADTEARAQEAVLVVDVTPYTKRQAEQIVRALRELEESPEVPRPWRIAALGRPFVEGRWTPGELSFRLPEVLREETTVGDTIGALRTTLKSLPGRGGTLIYLADWHFEDEHDLEDLIRDLEARRLAFGVVGSEAAFGRGWNDGILDLRDQLASGALVLGDPSKQRLYDEAIGRRPFGPFDREAPWHGGDTAYPHVPYRFSEELWKTTFAPGALRFGRPGSNGRSPSGSLEDLLERLGRDPESFTSSSSRETALPSAYGPYGLMRAAGERGGRYVLWSWNPEHRATLEYDYARCNEYGPDLRSRAAIREGLSRRGLARAMLQAWNAIGSKFNALSQLTPPLDRGGTRPQSIDLLERSATTLPTMWMNRDMYRDFLRKARHWRDAAASAEKLLTAALDRAGEPDNAVDQRLAADAQLFRHIMQVLHFELSEAIAAAESLPDEAWKDEETHPGIRPETWILPGDDPESIETTDATPFDPVLGERLKTRRAEHLRRFRGTPFGVQVAANAVETWVLTKGMKIKPSTRPLNPPGRTPGESEGTPPRPTPRTPRGGSSGGGPATGGD